MFRHTSQDISSPPTRTETQEPHRPGLSPTPGRKMQQRSGLDLFASRDLPVLGLDLVPYSEAQNHAKSAELASRGKVSMGNPQPRGRQFEVSFRRWQH